jgi:hypothetical protein
MRCLACRFVAGGFVPGEAKRAAITICGTRFSHASMMRGTSTLLAAWSSKHCVNGILVSSAKNQRRCVPHETLDCRVVSSLVMTGAMYHTHWFN